MQRHHDVERVQWSSAFATAMPKRINALSPFNSCREGREEALLFPASHYL
jgi:hypothetical protein